MLIQGAYVSLFEDNGYIGVSVLKIFILKGYLLKAYKNVPSVIFVPSEILSPDYLKRLNCLGSFVSAMI
jgi:hypothetical protein